MRKIFLFALSIMTLAVSANSIVFTLNDKVGTRVYFRIDADEAPKLVMHDDGTCTINGTEYAFANIKHFAFSKTDFQGEKNTIDAVGEVTEAPSMCLQDGHVILGGVRQSVSIYTIDGKLVSTHKLVSSINLSNLPKGGYVINDGVSTLKIQKR